MNKPLISVILPAYNCETTIDKAIYSILNQEYDLFELIVINDGSSDDTEKKILAHIDQRIKYIKNEKNLGLIKTLNKAIELASGDYIARMDADDISMPLRLKSQLQFFVDNPQHVMTGTFVKTFGKYNRIISYPQQHHELKGRLLFQNEFAHPSVMFKKDAFLNNKLKFNEDHLHVEDYGLWCEFSRIGQLHNIAKVYLHYSVSSESVSAGANKNIIERDDKHKIIYKNNFEALNLNVSPDELNLHRAIAVGSPYYFTKKEHLLCVYQWLTRIKNAVNINDYVPAHTFKKVLAYQWFVACNKASYLGINTIFTYYFSEYFLGNSVGLLLNIKFIYKCLIRYKSRNGKGFTN